jgi:tRNA(Ile)-lysidine synthase
MAARRLAGGVLWLRPLLGVRREALRAELRGRGIGWVEDPTNADPAYLRTRARAALAALAGLGIGPEGLAATAARLARARAALEAQAQAAMDALVREERGVLHLAPGLRDLPGETAERLMAHLLVHLSGAWHPPRRAEVQRLLAAGRGTLAGCALAPQGAGWLLWREARAVPPPAAGFWDHRWSAEGPGWIGALGEAGLLQLSRQSAAGLHPHWRDTGLPRAALAGLPGIWQDGRLIASPLTFWPQDRALTARPLAAIGGAEELSH